MSSWLRAFHLPIPRVVFLVFVLSTCTRSSGDIGNLPSAECETEACRLAALDAGDQQPPGESLVHTYQIALDALGDNCNGTDEQLGGYAMSAQELLSEGGVEDSILHILSDINDGVARGLREDCRETFFQYALGRVAL